MFLNTYQNAYYSEGLEGLGRVALLEEVCYWGWALARCFVCMCVLGHSHVCWYNLPQTVVLLASMMVWQALAFLCHLGRISPSFYTVLTFLSIVVFYMDIFISPKICLLSFMLNF